MRHRLAGPAYSIPQEGGQGEVRGAFDGPTLGLGGMYPPNRPWTLPPTNPSRLPPPPRAPLSAPGAGKCSARPRTFLLLGSSQPVSSGSSYVQAANFRSVPLPLSRVFAGQNIQPTHYPTLVSWFSGRPGLNRPGECVHPGGGRPLGSGRQLPPQLTVGRRPLGGRGGGHWRGGVQGGAKWGGVYEGLGGGGALLEGRLGGGVQVGQIGLVVGGGSRGRRFGVFGGGGQTPRESPPPPGPPRLDNAGTPVLGGCAGVERARAPAPAREHAPGGGRRRPQPTASSDSAARASLRMAFRTSGCRRLWWFRASATRCDW